MRRAVATSAVLAAASLLLLDEPAYDPTAWLLWGEQLSEGDLVMEGGPSWKPLPVLFTTAFALAGDGAAPLLWLALARAVGFLGIYLAYRVVRALGGGRGAGLLGAAGLALATDYLYNVVRGDTEGMLVAAAFGAIVLHLRGRRRAALALGIVAGLIRPEVWVVLAGYGLWLLWRDRRAMTIALCLGGAALLLAAWLLPDRLATGEWLRGARRAQNPVPGSPGASAFPFGMTFVYASISLAWPLYAGAVFAVRTRRPVVLGIAAAATALMVTVAVLAELGFTGNIRYVALPAALVAILGALGLPDAARAAQARLGRNARRAVAVLAAGAVAVAAGIVVYGAVRLVREDRVLGPELDAALAAAGGPAAVRACGQVSTTAFERQALAYRLDLPARDVWTHAERPGIAFIRAGREHPNAAALPVAARLRGWTVRRACR
jgi:MFS family permease